MTPTKTQLASHAADQAWREGRAAIVAAAVEEFPVGTKIKWQHLHGKAMTRGTVVKLGGCYEGDVRWTIKTASGVEHDINADRLYHADAPE